MCTAIGRKMTGSRMSLMKAAAQVGPSFLMAFAPSNPAPMLSSAIGVAQPPSMLRNLSAIGGKSIDSSENGRPARMPRMIGLVMMPRSVRLTTP